MAPRSWVSVPVFTGLTIGNSAKKWKIFTFKIYLLFRNGPLWPEICLEKDLRHNFHLRVGILLLVIFCQFLDPQSWKKWQKSKKWPIFQLCGSKSAKNENHKNSQIQMKIVPSILLQTNFWLQWTIFWGGDRFLRWKFFIYWAEFPIVKPAKREDAKTAQLVGAISWQSLRVGSKVSPFWKLDNQG